MPGLRGKLPDLPWLPAEGADHLAVPTGEPTRRGSVRLPVRAARLRSEGEQ
ncbi:hypothetical protein [Streptomyces broussonetiae]|uniref:Uncharacterized protein n=1 Tax=Streptomyces broussonetiae TaxID=2686304 RepID=A0A6I6NB04_9ACTN|nr:hypothetical protein [Streptomyces broussonetiae]QHA08642.1 hypothetical protein GQF42_40065 [Streptomyces broussonetiae]